MTSGTIVVLNGLSTVLLITYTSSILAYLSYMQNELITYGTPTLPILNILLTLIILSSMILVGSVVMVVRMFKGEFYNPIFLLIIHALYYLTTLVMFSIINNTPINNKDTSTENLNILKYKKFLLNMSIGYFVICMIGLGYSTIFASKEIEKWKDSNKESKSKEKIRNSENISAKYNNEKCQNELTNMKSATTKLKEQYTKALKDAIDESTYASQLRSGSGGMFGVPIQNQNQYQQSSGGLNTDNSPEAKIGELKKLRLLQGLL